MIADIIRVLQSNDFNGAGECTEIAKGKNESVTTWSGFIRKIKRIFKNR